MSTFCPECKGSGERNDSGFLDCAALNCTAATERAALDAHLLALGRLHERDVAWEAYKLGQAKATPVWISINVRLPEIGDYSVLAFWDHGGTDIVHAEEYFAPITNGFDEDGNQLFTRWYLNSGISHWMPLPAAPANNNTESKTTPVGD